MLRVLFLFLLIPQMAWATYWCVDPVKGSDATGSPQETQELCEVTPFRTMALVAIDDNDTLLLKRGTTLKLTDSIDIVNKTGVTVRDYGIGDKPKIKLFMVSNEPEDWREVEPNIWEFDSGKTGFNPHYLLGVGSTFRIGRRVQYIDPPTNFTPPDAAREWDFYAGSFSTHAKLYIYAELNPVMEYGSVQYGTFKAPAINLKNSSNTTIENLHFNVCGVAVLARQVIIGTSSNNTIQNCQFNTVWTGVWLEGIDDDKWVDGFTVQSCEFDWTRNAPVYISNYIQNVVIQDNKMSASNLEYSTGAIYIGNSYATMGNDIIIRRNIIDKVTFGVYWEYDGVGIFTDSDSANVKIYDNFLTRMHVAFKNNSGREGVVFRNNTSYDCEIAYWDSDATDVGESGGLVENNRFIACGLNTYQTDPFSYKTAIRIDNTLRVVLNSNIISSSGVGSGIGLVNYAIKYHTLKELDNILHNFKNDRIDITTGEIL